MIPTIDHWIGQGNAIRRIRVALEVCWNDGVRLPHLLLVGPPGMGKTEMAHCIGRELGVAVHERLAQVVSSVGVINGLLLKATDRDIVFIDEGHLLPEDVQTVLYRAMEGGRLSVQSRDQNTVTIPIKDVSIVIATTDQYRLLSPLRDRFKITISMTEYTVQELAKIILQRAQLVGIGIDAAVGQELAERSKSTPRHAVRLLESCFRYARSQGDNEITFDHFQRAMELDGIDHRGLGSDERRYLHLLAEHGGEGVRLYNIESALGIHKRTLQVVIEPYLVKAGLIERCPQGRRITQAGLLHLRDVPAATACE